MPAPVMGVGGCPGPCPHRQCVRGGARGWNIDYGRPWAGGCLVRRIVWSRACSGPRGGGGNGCPAGGVVGLARCWVLREQPACRGVASGSRDLPGLPGCWSRRCAWVVAGWVLGVGWAFGFVGGVVPPRVLRGWRTGCRRRSGGCLRTAQWTRASLNDLCGQVYKGTGWMPWHQEPKKDVVACDKPRGVGKRTVIRGCPNGETPPQSCVVTRT